MQRNEIIFPAIAIPQHATPYHERDDVYRLLFDWLAEKAGKLAMCIYDDNIASDCAPVEKSQLYLADALQKARELGYLAVTTENGWSAVFPHVKTWRAGKPSNAIDADHYFGDCMVISVEKHADRTISLNGYNSKSEALRHGWTFDLIEAPDGQAIQYRYIGNNPDVEAEIEALFTAWANSVANTITRNFSKPPQTTREEACFQEDHLLCKALIATEALNPLLKPAPTEADMLDWTKAQAAFRALVAESDARLSPVAA